MSSIEVVGLGAINIDRVYRVERILEDGEAIVKHFELHPGGSAANTIYGLAKLGISTGFVGVTGDDAESQIFLRDFQSVGVDTSQVKKKPHVHTGSVIGLSDGLGRRSLYVMPGANTLLTTVDLNQSYVNKASILHVSSFADDSQFTILTDLITRLERSTKISFAPGMLYASKGIQNLYPILSRTHILFINKNEIEQLTGRDMKAGAELCLRRGCKIVAVTLGKGIELETSGNSKQDKPVTAIAYIRNAEHEYIIELAGTSTLVADTTGAGDAFATGFIYGLLKEYDLQKCGILGNLVARFSLAKTGARQGLPDLSQLLRLYRDLYQTEL